MARSTSPSFVHEFALADPSTKVERVLLGRLEMARRLYNELLSEGLRRVDKMRQSVEFRHLRAELVVEKGAARRARCKIGTGEHEPVVRFANDRERREALASVRERHGLRNAYDLSPYATTLSRSVAGWAGYDAIGAAIIQHTLVEQTWRAIDNFAFGGATRTGRPRRRGWRNPLTSVTSSSSVKNGDTLRFRDGNLVWSGRHATVVLRALVDIADPLTIYALERPIKQVRVGYRPIRGRRRWYVQLVLAGDAYCKNRSPRDVGTVGVDVGARHVAIVGPSAAALVDLGKEVAIQSAAAAAKERRAARAQDRSRRATNPHCYDERGRWKKGARVHVRSRNFNAIGAERREAQRVLNETKRQQRQSLANETLRFGSEIRLEALSYRAWQAGGMGRTMRSSTPGGFVAALERACAKYQRPVVAIDARAACLSQLCHACGVKTKRPIMGAIPSRGNCCACGRESAQRDLYSAFLARFCDARGYVDTRQAVEAWPGASKLLGMAVSTYNQRTSVDVFASATRQRVGVRRHPDPTTFGPRATTT